jgi:hypothetical protein
LVYGYFGGYAELRINSFKVHSITPTYSLSFYLSVYTYLNPIKKINKKYEYSFNVKIKTFRSQFRGFEI